MKLNKSAGKQLRKNTTTTKQKDRDEEEEKIKSVEKNQTLSVQNDLNF